ncbi:MAG: homocysteine S-methyltransferase family protein [Oscillospiraceae bacterium]|jgi:5-methyltetrahydrofolate--homocysteine methyltransferase|nr:homocysteine S-methyltransferase family protein [Oscillospiraceae bacterium]
MFGGFTGAGMLFYDGAMGTMLQKRGLPTGARPDVMNITAPSAVEEVHRMYVEAGSDIICANTFGANRAALKSAGLEVGAVVGAAVSAALRASGGRAAVALDVGPIGEFMEPYGALTYEDAYSMFAELVRAGAEAGADIVAIETMSDLRELRAAITAAHESAPLPVFATMTFNADGHTYTGCAPESFAAAAGELGADAAGINCSLAPAVIYPIAERIAKCSNLPLIIKPNAGLPNASTGEYDLSPEEFARQMAQFTRLNMRVAGGCCGTTPSHIRELRRALGAVAS